jgi:predicted DNA-binding WGR domain protein
LTSRDDVLGFGWELHFENTSSDKFYRLIVVTGDDPIALGLHGSRGGDGQVGLLKVGITAAEALSHVVKKSREKENKGYEASREFTVFHLPASVTGSGDAKSNAHEIARYFGKYARQTGTELTNASYIPGSDF